MARLTNIRIRRSATPGNIPTTAQLDLGELALNTFDGKLYLKKDVNGTESVVEVGAGEQTGVWKEYVYTATSNQTSFSGLDDNSNTLSYVPDYLQVFLNGVLLDNGTDYTANTNSSVVLVNGANSGDLLQIATFTRMVGSADIAVDTFTPDGNTSVFSLSENPDVEENVQVYIDGVYQEQSTYTITSGNILTLDSNPPSGTTLEVSIGTRNVTLDNLEDLNISGKLLVGCTGIDTDAPNADGSLYTDGGNIKIRKGTSGFQWMQFYGTGVSSPIGSISNVSNTSTSYNTSSDERLKENIADANDAGAIIDAIKVRQYDWKVDGSHQDYGMVAQELIEVAPEAVSAPEDPEEMMGVDYSKLVPMLVKEIQSLRDRVAQLERNTAGDGE